VLWVRPAERIEGRLLAPPSKSQTLRALAAAALADGESFLHSASACDDARAAAAAARALGARVEPLGDGLRVRGRIAEPDAGFSSGESGLVLRAFAALAALGSRPVRLVAEGSLRRRPVGPLEDSLRALGARCRTASGLAPVEVHGPLRGGRARLSGAHTSQILSGLLLALPLAPEDSELEVVGLRSASYVLLTLEVLRTFGLEVRASPALDRFVIPGGQSARAARVRVEGDWSSAAFLLVLGALAGQVTLSNLRREAVQADRVVLEALEAASARPAWQADGSLRVEAGPCRAFDLSLEDCPDLFPPLAVLALGGVGESRLRGVSRLRHKESDRAEALVAELGRLGGRLWLEGDDLRVEGGRRLRAAEIDPRGDHRIAMACAVAAVALGEGATLRDAGCVAKSYPDFFDDLVALGGRVEEVGA
jgi:3-phosphoshikimate 1-carboxyvinyltransferase